MLRQIASVLLNSDDIDVNLRTPTAQRTALHLTMQKDCANEDDCFEMADMLLQFGADANARDKRGVLPLVEAATNGHGRMVPLLLNYGATLDQSNVTANDDGPVDADVALASAAPAASSSAVPTISEELLLVDYKKDRDGDTALIRACGCRHPLLVRKLLRHSDVATTTLDVNQRNRHGCNALHAVCNLTLNDEDFRLETWDYSQTDSFQIMAPFRAHTDDIIEQLLEAGVDVKARDDVGLTPLDRLMIALYRRRQYSDEFLMGAERVTSVRTYKLAFSLITSLVKAGSPVRRGVTFESRHHDVHIGRGGDDGDGDGGSFLSQLLHVAEPVLHNIQVKVKDDAWLAEFTRLVRMLVVLDCHATQRDCELVLKYGADELAHALQASRREVNSLRNCAVAAVRAHTTGRKLRQSLGALGLPRSLLAAVRLETTAQ